MANVPSIPSSQDLTAYVQGQVSAKLGDAQNVAEKVASMPADAQAQWDAATTPEANDARISAGASAAGDLVQHGFNPDDQGDREKMIAAIAGGLSLIPGVGIFLGAAVAILGTVAEAIAPLLYNWGLLPKPKFETSGNWTPSEALIWYQIPANIPGSFANFALSGITFNFAQWSNGKQFFNPSELLLGLINLWNAHASGPPQQIWVPFMNDLSPLPIFSSSLGGPSMFAATPGQTNANPLGPPGDVQLAEWAFQPFEKAAAAGMLPYGHVISVNAGPFVAPTVARVTATVARARAHIAAQNAAAAKPTPKAPVKKVPLHLAGLAVSNPHVQIAAPPKAKPSHAKAIGIAAGLGVVGFAVAGPVGAFVGAAAGIALDVWEARR